VVAIDRAGLQSGTAEAAAIQSEDYALSATVQRDGVHLEWDPRDDEGFHGTYVYRTTLLGKREFGLLLRKREFGLQAGGQFHDPNVDPGSTHRYFVVLERTDGSLAPPSAPVQITIPELRTD
jgi:hypothetical protein